MINAAIVSVQTENVDHIINNSPTLSSDGTGFSGSYQEIFKPTSLMQLPSAPGKSQFSYAVYSRGSKWEFFLQ